MGYKTCSNCQEGCKYFERAPKPELRKTQDNGGYMDRHHIYFPKGFYKTVIEQAFRNLPENILTMCRADHDELHATTPPPEKPPRSAMIEAIARSAIDNSGEVA